MICRIHAMLHHAMKTAEQEHLIVKNPAEGAAVPKANYKSKQILNKEQLNIFLAEIEKDEVWHDFFYTELTTGLRRGEICGRMWQDFDKEKGTLNISRTLHCKRIGEYTTGETKTGKGTRTIALPKGTADILRARKQTALTEWIFPNPTMPELPTAPLSTYHQMKTLLKNVGLPSIRFHDLRHTFALTPSPAAWTPRPSPGFWAIPMPRSRWTPNTHTTGDMQKRAAEIVGDFMTDIFGEELKPWEESAKTAKAPSV